MAGSVGGSGGSPQRSRWERFWAGALPGAGAPGRTGLYPLLRTESLLRVDRVARYTPRYGGRGDLQGRHRLPRRPCAVGDRPGLRQAQEQVRPEGAARRRTPVPGAAARAVQCAPRARQRQSGTRPAEDDRHRALGSRDLLPVGETTCTLMQGESGGVRFLGWSTNLQSGSGESNVFKPS